MRVLVASVPAGSGHVRAAEALTVALRSRYPDVETVHVHVTDLVRSGFRRLYVDGYHLTINRAPGLWGRIYNYWDQKSTDSRITPLLYGAQRLCAGNFYEYLNRFRPDVILTTHFLVPQLLAARSAIDVHPRIESVITDYDVHRFWVSDQVSRYYVAHEGMVEMLGRQGISASRVTVSGIPVHPDFSERYSPSAIFRSLNLDPQLPVILLLSGGFGLNQLSEAVKQLFHLPIRVQVVTVSGRNAALRERLDTLNPPPTMKLVNLGYVRNMPQLLTISDLVMTKPGGLSISECLAKRKLMVLFPALPGQEQKNAAFLLAREAAVQVQSLNELAPTAARLLTDRAERERLLSNVDRYSRPHAAFAITEILVNAHSLAA